MLNADNLFTIVGKLGRMAFFPSDVDSRFGIAEDMADMCDTEEQAAWLVKRMVHLFPKGWPGAGEMRAVYCSKFKPRDGVEVPSAAFPLGIPSESPQRDAEIMGHLAGASKDRKQLSAGETERVSAADSIQTTIEVLREAKSLRRTGPAPLVPSIPVVKLTDENRVTEADFEWAREEVRRLREKGGGA